MTLPFFPNFGNFIWGGRQGESVNLRRTADHADHQRKWTVPYVAKSQRRSIIPTIPVKQMPGDRGYFPRWIHRLVHPVEFSVGF